MARYRPGTLLRKRSHSGIRISRPVPMAEPIGDATPPSSDHGQEHDGFGEGELIGLT